jgi:glycosyltransferase involved in cell wall biosynthesis
VHAADALAGAGLLGRYHVPLAPNDAQLDQVERWLPPPLAAPVVRELRRRVLPAAVSPSLARATGTFSDLARVAARRIGLSDRVRQRVGAGAVWSFDRQVASALRPSDAGLLAIAGCASRSIREARRLGIASVLDCPLGDHGYVRDLMREEARLRPEWASTLQLHDLPDHAVEGQLMELRNAGTILVLSTFSKRTLHDHVDPDRVLVTPLGVDIELFKPRPRPDDATFRVIFSGYISQRKGLSYLIDGFARANIPDSELLMVGQVVGTSRPWSGRRGVRHVPHVPRRELPDYYGLGDVYVFPSLVEGFGLTALEAMACGLPVILSSNTFAEDVITDGVEGFIVPIRDSAAIAERLRLLAADPERRARMGAAARRTAEQHSWTRYGRQIVGIFSDLLPQSGSPRG